MLNVDADNDESVHRLSTYAWVQFLPTPVVISDFYMEVSGLYGQCLKLLFVNSL